jgi:hypothetical protein
LPLEDLLLTGHCAADSSAVDFAVSGASYQLEQGGTIGVMFGGAGGGGRLLPLASPNPWGFPRVAPTI